MSTSKRGPSAAELLEEALALERGMSYPYAEAKMLYTAGQLHAARDETEQARERFEPAPGILRRLGEQQDAEHVERAVAVSRAAHATGRIPEPCT